MGLKTREVRASASGGAVGSGSRRNGGQEGCPRMAKACGGPGRGRQPWAVQCGAGTGRDPPHSISAKGLPLQRFWLRFPGQQPHLGRINRGGALKKREGMLLVDPPCSEGWVLLPVSQEGVAHRNALGRARAVAPGGGATGRGTRSPGPSDVALQAGRGWETAGIWERGGAPPPAGKGPSPNGSRRLEAGMEPHQEWPVPWGPSGAESLDLVPARPAALASSSGSRWASFPARREPGRTLSLWGLLLARTGLSGPKPRKAKTPGFLLPGNGGQPASSRRIYIGGGGGILTPSHPALAPPSGASRGAGAHSYMAPRWGSRRGRAQVLGDRLTTRVHGVGRKGAWLQHTNGGLPLPKSHTAAPLHPVPAGGGQAPRPSSPPVCPPPHPGAARVLALGSKKDPTRARAPFPCLLPIS